MKNRLQFDDNQLEFPLILGRDFAGEIIRKGPKVTKFKIGDKVTRNNENFLLFFYLQ